NLVRGLPALLQACRHEPVELRDELVRELRERRTVLLAPPGMQVAVAVELRALVVETVADLVTDDRADRAEIAGGVGVHAEERWAQDRRGEGDVIHHRVVESVDGLRGGKPGRRIRGLTHLVDLVVVVEPAGRPHVIYQVRTAGSELQPIEFAPLLRVADLRAELTQL